PPGGLPLGPLPGRHLVGAVPLEVLPGDAVDGIQLGLAADEQDFRRVRLGVDRQGDRGAAAQRRQLPRVLRGAHDDLRAVPGEPDRDRPGRAVEPDESQPGQVTGQEFLAEWLVEDLVERALIHDRFPPRIGGWRRWTPRGRSRARRFDTADYDVRDKLRSDQL